MARILLVEDDDLLRTALSQSLALMEHTVSEASNGKAAQTILQNADIDLILSDVQMPEFNGIELLEWAKTHRPVPFILMTGFTDLLETKSAYELGADEFLAKPFQSADLAAAIKNTLARKETSRLATENIDSLYYKVSLEEFVAKQQTDFDVYVRLSEQKYVKISNRGDLIPRERLYAYREKGVEFMHIRKVDFNRLVGAAVANPLPAELVRQRTDFLSSAEDELDQKLHFDGVDEDAFTDARDFLSLALNLMTENESTCKILTDVKNHSETLHVRDLAVALYSTMMARKLEYSSSQLFFKLSLAAMLQDVGKSEIPRVALEKPSKDWTPDEREMMEAHPTRAHAILSNIKDLASDVVQMVYEHEEDETGQGFPRKLRAEQLHPLSKILIVANRFIERTVKSLPHSPGMTAEAAIRQLEAVYRNRLDRGAMNALRAIFSAN